MAAENVLTDTSFLYSFFDKTDDKHQLTRSALKDSRIHLIVPDVVLAEVTYLLKAQVGMHAVVKFLDGLVAAQTPLEPVIISDLTRIREIMEDYADARFDFVDCCIMALAERLNITRVYTFDHRDFRIFRPKHCDYLNCCPQYPDCAQSIRKHESST
jgi:predicted nucleic acid-binding protein